MSSRALIVLLSIATFGCHASAPCVDASSDPVADAGAAPVGDAGAAPVHDAGAAQIDAGHLEPEPDACVPCEDAGVELEDSGAPIVEVTPAQLVVGWLYATPSPIAPRRRASFAFQITSRAAQRTTLHLLPSIEPEAPYVLYSLDALRTIVHTDSIELDPAETRLVRIDIAEAPVDAGETLTVRMRVATEDGVSAEDVVQVVASEPFDQPDPSFTIEDASVYVLPRQGGFDDGESELWAAPGGIVNIGFRVWALAPEELEIDIRFGSEGAAGWTVIPESERIRIADPLYANSFWVTFVAPESGEGRTTARIFVHRVGEVRGRGRTLSLIARSE